MSHTPGPWKYHNAGVMVMDRDGQMSIADVRGWGTLSRLHGEQKALQIQDANGRLIAAAPELLERLTQAHNQLHELVLVFVPSGDAALDQTCSLMRDIRELVERVRSAG